MADSPQSYDDSGDASKHNGHHIGKPLMRGHLKNFDTTFVS
jgi:hypothetical protein